MKTLYCSLVQDREDLELNLTMDHYYSYKLKTVKDRVISKLVKKWGIDPKDIESRFEIIITPISNDEIEDL